MTGSLRNHISLKSRPETKRTVFWRAGRVLYYLPALVSSVRYLFRKRITDRKTVFVMIEDLESGGAGRVATVLASELAASYHVILLYARNPRGTYPISADVDQMLIPLALWNPRKASGFFCRFIRTLKRRQGAHASISLLATMNIINTRSRAGDKVICSERSNPLKNDDRYQFEDIQSCYEQADHVIFQSETVRDLFSEKVRSHCSILPNPVGVYHMRSSGTEHRIVNFSRLHEQKNPAMLIRVFKQFHNKHPEYTLSLYGEGPQRDELSRLILDLGLQEAVQLKGLSAQIHRDIADAEFFVLTSDYEGLSNSLLEAMMMGFPCISTDCEGSTDVIEDGVNGLLIHRGNEDELLAAMLKLAEDTSYREELGRRAKQTAERFQRKKVAEQWAEVIERV